MPLALSRRRSTGGGGLVTIGRLTPQKRFHLAVAAHGRLQATRPGLGLTIIGDGPERPRLEALARELGTAERVQFVGQVSPTAVADTIGDADLCLFPAVAEGLGLAAIEALAAGVPVVACRDGGGLLDIVQEPGAGLVVEPDPAAIASAADQILSRPGRGDQAARAGDRWREALDPKRIAARFEALYLEAIRG
jgi:glycosyltransferase involved in cell wall biosynthesis